VAWIDVIPSEDAEGDLLQVYIDHEIDEGPIFPPYEVLTNNGPALLGLTKFQQAVRFGPSPLSRLQREMIATLTSAATGCVF
jgi:alkylhydroperoxidase family enzyme